MAFEPIKILVFVQSLISINEMIQRHILDFAEISE
ncbi:MAG: hypothetical protein METHSR3v1_1100011 [Methanothrix sp.]|nr:MAG: hypothetical protein METHSR3v1_1100011 [Methanothrix sp.]